MKHIRLRQWLSPRPASRPRRPGTFRPAVESLEVRLAPSIVPASMPANVTTGSGGQAVTTQRAVGEAANGTYRVVWENHIQGANYGICTRLFSAAGAPQGNPYLVPGTGGGDSEATLAVSPTGAFTIAWTHTVGQAQSVLMQRFNAAGATVGSPVTVSSFIKTGCTHQPSVAMDTAGDVVLAYTDSAAVGTDIPFNDQVRGVYYPAAGAASPLRVALTATSQPSAAMNATGGFVIAFVKYESLTDADVFAQRFLPGGSAQGTAVTVAGSTFCENQPSAAIDAQGDFVVAYTCVRAMQAAPQPLFPDCINYQSEGVRSLQCARAAGFSRVA